MIRTTGLRAGYGGAEKLHGIDLKIERGCITVIVGPNGCGKSTLLKTICGLLPRSAGSVELDGRPLDDYTGRELAQRLAVLPQSRNLPAITARRMVLHGRFPYLEYPRRYRKQDYEIAQEAMEQVGIGDFADRSMEALSGGERQKVYLAMALAQQTPVVLLDEPTTFLDVRHQLEVIEIAKELRCAGKTVVMVLHDLNLALRCADKLVVLSEGVVAACGAAEAVAQNGVLDGVFGVETQLCRNDKGEIYYAFAHRK